MDTLPAAESELEQGLQERPDALAWLLAQQPEKAGRDKADIDRQIAEERDGWAQ